MVWNSIRVPVFILGCFIAAGLTKTQHVEFVDMAVFWDCIGDLAGPGESTHVCTSGFFKIHFLELCS